MGEWGRGVGGWAKSSLRISSVGSLQSSHNRAGLLTCCCIARAGVQMCQGSDDTVSCSKQKDSYNCVHIAGVSLHASEAYPHGQLPVDPLGVQEVVLHVRADGLHLVEVLVPYKEGELHLAGLVEVDNYLCLGNARLIADDLL